MLKEIFKKNWENSVLEYQGRRFLILKQFKVKESTREYLYGAEVETIGTERMNVVFLYKIGLNMWQHVENDEVFEFLFEHVASLLAAECENAGIDVKQASEIIANSKK